MLSLEKRRQSDSTARGAGSNLPSSANPAEQFSIGQSLHFNGGLLVKQTGQFLVEPLLEARELGVAAGQSNVGEELRPHALLALEDGVVDELGEAAGLLVGEGRLQGVESDQSVSKVGQRDETALFTLQPL